MKKTLLFLAAWLLTSQYSFCQMSKTGESSMNDTKLASSIKAPGEPVSMEGMQYITLQKPVPGTADKIISQAPANLPDKAGGKSHLIESHTQNLLAKTKTIEANTQALEANTRALEANTDALRANMNAVKVNKHLRATKAELAASPAKTPVHTEAPRAEVAAKTPAMPADKPKHAAKQLAANVAAPAKAQVKPQIPQEKAPVKTALKLPQPLAAATVKAPAKRVAMLENSTTINTLTPTPAKTIQQPKTVSQPKTAAAVKTNAAMKRNRNITVADLAVLPSADKTYDSKTFNSNHTPVATAAGLKEGDVITTQGYLQVVATEDSGKETETYCLQITASSASKDSCFFVKISSADLQGMTKKGSAKSAKEYVRDCVVKGKVPCTGGNLMHTPVFVSITGALAYDAFRANAMRHTKPVYMGKRGMHTYTAWQIGNVNRIEFTTP